ncbi:MAG: Gfo/Idh/MocA family oxidoreductase [Paludisphaera borealis]|uniref:Gfo/Idh/MocA family protein n=1 Tax=Paludisphaera borealis TaxID=1387353 RepID=UPI002845CC9B|nr:Gfo/Idh/MocA family oxidoreductase [Paludisphaera borealis]MDR3619699.1 Gfo/Idh/MocA family oxidoreductase [Paludisphaera borealis]
MRDRESNTRRDFFKTAAAASTAFTLLSRNEDATAAGPNDKVRIATIGMGIIGFIDTDCALKVPGVELVAAADLYEGRRKHVKERYGDRVDTYVDYREILARKDVDAVLLCVPDHWHSKMSIDAMKAGKAVYCEKPMVRTVEEGPEVIRVQQETKAVFQVGSQYASSIVFDKLKEMVAAGAIGKVNVVEARFNRNSSLGAWQYTQPTDASPETVDWDRFLGSAPKRPFDATRFFRWRNYQDYGTAVAGDLFVHLLTGVHHATGSLGPNKVAAMGGLRYWDDGRDVYDVILGLLDYPATDAHPSFTLSLQCDFEDGGGDATAFRFVGDEGVISVGFDALELKRVGVTWPTPEQELKGYNSVQTFSKAQQEAIAAKLASVPTKAPKTSGYKGVERYQAPAGYDARYDHFVKFFRSVREAQPVYEDAVFGYRAAAPALLCNNSYFQGKMFGWDPVKMQVTS